MLGYKRVHSNVISRAVSKQVSVARLVTRRQVKCLASASTEQAQPPAQRVDPWKKIYDLERSGEPIEVVVRSVNRGGVVVRYGDLEGFVPYQQLAVRRSQAADMSYLVGQRLKAKITAIETKGNRKEMILSEKKAHQSEMLKRINVGTATRAVVQSVEEYGVFVELVDMPGLVGMVHKSEISWDPVMTAQDAGLTKGQVIVVKVTEVDPVKTRLSLSMKQLTPDPLKITLDDLPWGPTARVDPEIQRLIDQLQSYPGVGSVIIARQAQDPHHVAQQLQVFLTKTSADASVDDDGSFVVVARLGTVLQELQLLTELKREEVKAALSSAVAAVTK